MILLYQIPNDQIVWDCLMQLKDWYATHLYFGTPILAGLGWLAYKTPWKWDDNVITWIYNKLGIRSQIEKWRTKRSQRVE